MRAAFFGTVARAAVFLVIAPVVSLAAIVCRVARAILRIVAEIVFRTAGKGGLTWAVLRVAKPAVAVAAVLIGIAFAILVETPVISLTAEEL